MFCVSRRRSTASMICSSSFCLHRRRLRKTAGVLLRTSTRRNFAANEQQSMKSSQQFSFPKTFCACCYVPLSGNEDCVSTTKCPHCQKRLYCSSRCQHKDYSAAHHVFCGVSGEINVDFEIRHINPQVGVGLVALRDFLPNETIFVEHPIVMAPNDNKNKRKNSAFPTVPDSAKEAVAAMLPHGGNLQEKINVNAIDCNEDDAGLFLVLALANHDCLGNADHMYLPDYGGVRIMVASQQLGIRKGQEIRHYYTDPLLPRTQRRAKLHRMYGIHDCRCALCVSDVLEAKVSAAYQLNERLEESVELGLVYEAIRTGEELLAMYDRLWEDDGVALSTKLYMWVYFDMFRAAIMRQDTVDDGVDYLRQAHRCYLDYCGTDQLSDIKKIEQLIEAPQAHREYLKMDRREKKEE